MASWLCALSHSGRRLGMRHLWAYIVFSGLTAIAFTFPLFLANRARRLQQLTQETTAAVAAE